MSSARTFWPSLSRPTSLLINGILFKPWQGGAFCNELSQWPHLRQFVTMSLTARIVACYIETTREGRAHLRQLMEDGHHILVVDDHRDIRDPLAAYLKKHGFRVTTAAESIGARDAFLKNAIDLVVLDIMMPGEKRLGLCR